MTASTPGQPDRAGVFDEQQDAECVRRDAGKAVETMVDTPSVRMIPTQAGGDGREPVYRFYEREGVPSLPPNLRVTLVSRTVGADRLVAEDILEFSPTLEVPWPVPGVPPTGRRIEVPGSVLVAFEGGEVARERVWWDQASVRAQVGWLEAGQFPVVGNQAAVGVRARTRTATP